MAKEAFGDRGTRGLYSESEFLANKDALIEEMKRRFMRIKTFPDLNIVLVFGLARSGTTALQMILTQAPKVVRSEFQPWKNMMRHGIDKSSSFNYGSNGFNDESLVVLKETLGPLREDECLMDPIGMLIQSGIPANRIRTIFILRDPRLVFYSWNSLMSAPLSQYLTSYELAQKTMIGLFDKYKAVLPYTIPLYYEKLGEGEEQVIHAILDELRLPRNGSTLRFDRECLEQRIRWNEAESDHYWNAVVEPIIKRGEFVYCQRQLPNLPDFVLRVLEGDLMKQFKLWQVMVDEFFEQRKAS